MASLALSILHLVFRARPSFLYIYLIACGTVAVVVGPSQCAFPSRIVNKSLFLIYGFLSLQPVMSARPISPITTHLAFVVFLTPKSGFLFPLPFPSSREHLTRIQLNTPSHILLIPGGKYSALTLAKGYPFTPQKERAGGRSMENRKGASAGGISVFVPVIIRLVLSIPYFLCFEVTVVNARKHVRNAMYLSTHEPD